MYYTHVRNKHEKTKQKNACMQTRAPAGQSSKSNHLALRKISHSHSHSSFHFRSLRQRLPSNFLRQPRPSPGRRLVPRLATKEACPAGEPVTPPCLPRLSPVRRRLPPARLPVRERLLLQTCCARTSPLEKRGLPRGARVGVREVKVNWLIY